MKQYKVITEDYLVHGHNFQIGDIVEKGKDLGLGLCAFTRVSDGEEQFLEDEDVEEIQSESK